MPRAPGGPRGLSCCGHCVHHEEACAHLDPCGVSIPRPLILVISAKAETQWPPVLKGMGLLTEHYSASLTLPLQPLCLPQPLCRQTQHPNIIAERATQMGSDTHLVVWPPDGISLQLSPVRQQIPPHSLITWAGRVVKFLLAGHIPHAVALLPHASPPSLSSLLS